MASAMQLQKDAQNFSREQWKLQTELSNTAHQREVADLRAAGLNPVLSAGGQGASSQVTAGDSGSSAAASLLAAKESARAQKYSALMNYKAAQTSAAAQMYSTKYSTDYNKNANAAGLVSSAATKIYRNNPLIKRAVDWIAGSNKNFGLTGLIYDLFRKKK